MPFSVLRKSASISSDNSGARICRKLTAPYLPLMPNIETDLLGYFKMMGAAARVLDGAERLEVLHGVFHPDGELFRFDWKWLPTAGLSTKDFIAPSSLRFGNPLRGDLEAAGVLRRVCPAVDKGELDVDGGVHIVIEVTEVFKSGRAVVREARPAVGGGDRADRPKPLHHAQGAALSDQ